MRNFRKEIWPKNKYPIVVFSFLFLFGLLSLHAIIIDRGLTGVDYQYKLFSTNPTTGQLHDDFGQWQAKNRPLAWPTTAFFAAFIPQSEGFVRLLQAMLHLFITLLFAALLWRLFKDVTLAFLAAILFLHSPFNWQAVYWLSALPMLFATLFALSSAHLLLFAYEAKRHWPLHLLAMVALFLFAISFHEIIAFIFAQALVLVWAAKHVNGPLLAHSPKLKTGVITSVFLLLGFTLAYLLFSQNAVKTPFLPDGAFHAVFIQWPTIILQTFDRILGAESLRFTLAAKSIGVDIMRFYQGGVFFLMISFALSGLGIYWLLERVPVGETKMPGLASRPIFAALFWIALAILPIALIEHALTPKLLFFANLGFCLLLAIGIRALARLPFFRANTPRGLLAVFIAGILTYGGISMTGIAFAYKTVNEREQAVLTILAHKVVDTPENAIFAAVEIEDDFGLKPIAPPIAKAIPIAHHNTWSLTPAFRFAYERNDLRALGETKEARLAIKPVFDAQGEVTHLSVNGSPIPLDSLFLYTVKEGYPHGISPLVLLDDDAMQAVTIKLPLVQWAKNKGLPSVKLSR